MSRFPIFRQHDSMQCGIACLQMVCAYFGKIYSLEYLSAYCFSTSEGVSLLSICEAGCLLGFHPVYGKLAVGQLGESVLPCILHWDQNHFVVLYRIRRRKRGDLYYIADPGRGLLRLTGAEFCLHWVSARSQGEDKGIALFLQPTPAFYERGGEQEPQKRSFSFLFGYFRQYLPGWKPLLFPYRNVHRALVAPA